MTLMTDLDVTILQCLRYSGRAKSEIYRATNGHARAIVDQALDNLRAAKLLEVRFKQVCLTKQGRNALPNAANAIAQQGVYQAPPVARRPGSCTQHIPSRYGDSLEYRPAGPKESAR